MTPELVAVSAVAALLLVISVLAGFRVQRLGSLLHESQNEADAARDELAAIRLNDASLQERLVARDASIASLETRLAELGRQLDGDR
ncbi:MAG: hypothetical protein O3B72_08700, partial [Proteobacteria bacterium]|nr:hypothetical protein [Pseudomonadota bacterium]